MISEIDIATSACPTLLIVDLRYTIDQNFSVLCLHGSDPVLAYDITELQLCFVERSERSAVAAERQRRAFAGEVQEIACARRIVDHDGECLGGHEAAAVRAERNVLGGSDAMLYSRRSMPVSDTVKICGCWS